MVLTAKPERPRKRTDSLFADDRGIMLIEVLVSAVLLIVISLATLAVIDRAGEASAMNRARSVATVLAQKDQDKVRQWPFSRMQSMFGTTVSEGDTRYIYGTTDADSDPVDIDGRRYEVRTKLEVVKGGDEPTACLAGWKQLRLKIRTTVTPPPGHKMKEITMETYRVPTISDQPLKGSVIVRLMKANGNGAQGATVTVDSIPAGVGTKSQPTGADGCAVINDVDPGLKSVKWNQGGTWVDENGATEVERRVTVSAGKTAQMAGRWDEASSRTVNFTNGVASDTTPAKWKTVTFVQSGITTVYNGRRKFPTAAATSPLASISATALFPFETTYGAFAGTCWGNNPDAWPGATQTATSSLVGPNTTGSIDVLMPLVTITGLSGTGWKITANPRQVSEMGPCGESARSGSAGDPGPTSTVAGEAKIALPFGTWRLCVSNATQRYPNLDFNNTPDGATTYPPDKVSGVRGKPIAGSPSNGSC